MRAVQVGTVVLSAVLLTSASIRVGAEEEQDARTRAVEIASEGIALYKAEDYAAAVVKFTEAYRIYPEPRLLLNRSRAQWKLSRCNDALSDAKLYRAAASASSGASADAPDAWLETLQRSCIDAEVVSTPPGAAIWINGERQASPDRTPWVGRLPVGSHRVLLWLPGYERRSGYLDVEADQPSHLEMVLTPEQASSGSGAPGASQTPPASMASDAGYPRIEVRMIPEEAAPQPALPAVSVALAPQKGSGAVETATASAPLPTSPVSHGEGAISSGNAVARDVEKRESVERGQ
jgi:hypothetical protein